MTPEERNLVIELFDRLATLEDAQRDPEAERLIRDGLRQAPNAPSRSCGTARRARPQAGAQGSLSGIFMRGVGERIPERLRRFLRAQHSPRRSDGSQHLCSALVAAVVQVNELAARERSALAWAQFL